jgi:hypothetical protein
MMGKFQIGTFAAGYLLKKAISQIGKVICKGYFPVFNEQFLPQSK